MLIGDILRTCANERIAEAAVASIGGDFAQRLAGLADRCGLSVGALTSVVVRGFGEAAGERDLRAVAAAMAGHDTPILRGLEAVVDIGMQSAGTTRYLATLASEAGDGVPVWAVGPDMRVEVLGAF